MVIQSAGWRLNMEADQRSLCVDHADTLEEHIKCESIVK